MQEFHTHRGLAVQLVEDNINTDQIIPSREMKRVSKSGLADGLFANLRYLDANKGGRTPDPEFVLNRPEADGATILIGGANFGCGSSREHAVWGLKEYGFRAVIAESFAMIFRDNCVANGMPPVSLSREAISALAAESHNHDVEVDLDDMQVTCGNLAFGFTLSDEQRGMLRSGMSPIDLTMKDGAAIDAFIASDRGIRPWLYESREENQWSIR